MTQGRSGIFGAVATLTLLGALALTGSCADDEEGVGGASGNDASVGGTGGTSGSGGAGGSGGLAGTGGSAGQDAGPTEPLDPLLIPKFQHTLIIPPAMPPKGKTGSVTEYEIAARQFQQQVLPPGLPKTTVWGFGKPDAPGTFNTPAFSIEARSNEPVQVKWLNDLVDAAGNYLPHLLTVDPTLHWANPPGPPDSMGMTSTPYTGPVPIVTHLHGGHTPAVSDGHPEAWWLPNAKNIPAGYSSKGTHFGTTKDVGPGAALFLYPNDQRASTLWYHDHALGITRVNVYAGLAGFYLLRDAQEDGLGLPGPAPQVGDAAGTRYYEIPLAFQDRAFNTDGSLRYPKSRADFDGYTGPFMPATSVHPFWNPESFGDTLMVNGRVWPYVEVEHRLYRLRLLNGCNSRTLRLAFDKKIDFHQIGNDGGLLSGAPAKQSEILLMPGERADVLVDLKDRSPGEVITLLNRGPDEPFKGLAEDQDPANPATTGLVMQLRVVAATTDGKPGAIPTALPVVAPLGTTLSPRDLTLSEEMYEPADIPVEAALGTPDKGPLEWGAAPTETPTVGDTEIWRIFNLTADAHPVHLHLVMFQVLDRTPFDADGYAEAWKKFLAKQAAKPKVEDFFTGSPAPALASESAFKDTVVANPGEVTRLIATFDLAGNYVWHCHILEHEDNEMMRPLVVMPK